MKLPDKPIRLRIAGVNGVFTAGLRAVRNYNWYSDDRVNGISAPNVDGFLSAFHEMWDVLDKARRVKIRVTE